MLFTYYIILYILLEIQINILQLLFRINITDKTDTQAIHHPDERTI